MTFMNGFFRLKAFKLEKALQAHYADHGDTGHWSLHARGWNEVSRMLDRRQQYLELNLDTRQSDQIRIRQINHDSGLGGTLDATCVITPELPEEQS